jgi:hypothetical protein
MNMKEHIDNYGEQALDEVTRVAAGIGIGVISGLIGTAVMTIAQMIEMKITGREASDMPYQAVKKTFDVQAQSDEDKEKLSNITHWAYGTAWGIPRGLLAVHGADGVAGTSLHFAGVWGAEQVMLPKMDLMEPITEQEPKAIGQDVLFHVIYAVAAGLTADLLARRLR